MHVPTTRRERMKGLRGWTSLGPAEALFLERTRSVHTFGMAFSIVVATLDRELRVLTVRPMPPGRLLLPRPRVHHVLEFAIEADVRPGDVLLRH